MRGLLALLLCCMGATAAGADQERAMPVVATPDEEKLAIYGAFLDDWNRRSTTAVQVAEVLQALPSRRELSDSECVDLDAFTSARTVEASTPKPFLTLVGTPIAHRPDVLLINAVHWDAGDEWQVDANGFPIYRPRGLNHRGLLTLSDILFDDTHHMAVFRYGHECGPLCFQGGLVKYEIRTGVWTAGAKDCSYMIA